MRNILTVGFVVLGLSLVAWSFWDVGDPVAPIVPTAAEPRSEDLGPDREELAAAAGQAAPSPAASSRAEDAVSRTAVDGAVDARFLTIQIWDREEGVPATEAEVFVCDDLNGKGVDWSGTKGAYGRHWSTVAERQGVRYGTDQKGQVSIPNLKGNLLIAARQPGAYAFRWLQNSTKDDQVATLTLADDATLTVRVVDGSGKPVADAEVGVLKRTPIAGTVEQIRGKVADVAGSIGSVRKWMEDNPKDASLASEKLHNLERDRSQFERDLRGAVAARTRGEEGKQKVRVAVRARRRSDQNGLVVIEHFQLYRGEERITRKSGWKKGGKGKGSKSGAVEAVEPPWFEAALIMPLQEPVAVRFERDAVPEDAIELRMPATGSLALRTVDRDGRPFAHSVTARLLVESDLPADIRHTYVRKEEGAAWIEFPHVGLGMTLSAQCELDDDDFSWNASAFSGPTVAGELAVVDLVVAPDAGMLHARLVDADGAALVGVKPTFLISSSSGRVEGERILTDGEGRFHLPYLVRAKQRPPYRLEVRREDVEPTQGLAMPLGAGLPTATVTDLGDLVAGAFTRIASGRVVDDRGATIEGAELRLQRERALGDSGERRFVDEAYVETETDAQGEFVLFGDIEQGRYRLRVEADGHFDQYVELSDFGPGMAIELQRRAELIATLALPEWMRIKDLRPVLVPQQIEGSRRQQRGRAENRDGVQRVRFNRVRAGLYTLEFWLQSFPAPFFSVDRVLVEAGQSGVHPQLQDLNLRGHLFRFDLRAVNQNGESIRLNRPQLARVRDASGDLRFIALPLKGRGGEVISPSSQLEVFPLCEGYVADPQIVTQGRSEIVFRELPAVEVVLPGLRDLAGTVPVRVELELIELAGYPESLEGAVRMGAGMSAWYARSRVSSARLNAEDVASLRVVASGRHRMKLRFGGKKKGGPELRLEDVDLQVEPGAAPLRITPSYDRAAAQQIVDEVRRAAGAAERRRQR